VRRARQVRVARLVQRDYEHLLLAVHRGVTGDLPFPAVNVRQAPGRNTTRSRLGCASAACASSKRRSALPLGLLLVGALASRHPPYAPPGSGGNVTAVGAPQEHHKHTSVALTSAVGIVAPKDTHARMTPNHALRNTLFPPAMVEETS
jgi:hypothetical protein